MKFRTEAEIWPMMSDEELRSLAKDIDENGQAQSIKLFNGEILDGRNRWLAITKFGSNGHKPRFEEVNPSSPISYVISQNEKRRHLNESQRALAAARAEPFFAKEAAARAAAGRKKGGEKAGKGRPIASGPIGPEAKEHRARDDAAATFSATPRTVQRAKKVITQGSSKLIQAVESGNLSIGKAEQIVNQSPDKKKQDAVVSSIAKSKMTTRVKGLTGEVEWYTPPEYLALALSVLGSIDLDPASSANAQKNVKAKRFFSMDDDGLAQKQKWSGRVFLNPPYAMPFVKQFVSKLVESVASKDVTEAILLVNNATDTEWFHSAIKACSSVCFTRGRISFLEVRDGEMLSKGSPTHGQAFIYFGSNVKKFEKVFAGTGLLLRRSST